MSAAAQGEGARGAVDDDDDGVGVHGSQANAGPRLLLRLTGYELMKPFRVVSSPPNFCGSPTCIRPTPIAKQREVVQKSSRI